MAAISVDSVHCGSQDCIIHHECDIAGTLLEENDLTNSL